MIPTSASPNARLNGGLGTPFREGVFLPLPISNTRLFRIPNARAPQGTRLKAPGRASLGGGAEEGRRWVIRGRGQAYRTRARRGEGLFTQARGGERGLFTYLQKSTYSYSPLLL